MKNKDKKIQQNFEELIYNFDQSLRPLRSKERRQILNITKDNPLKISEIGKKLNINDHLLWRHIKILSEAKLISLDKREKERGRPVYVQSYMNPEEQLLSLKALIEISLEDLEKLKK